ncbi:MAG: 1-deoxy-D-xylulose-5-phosphate reductoisomerase [Lachnospiraceae bacterium]|nr:1-deoxy-D-xylulose-5-phosphate reductoisomerase [Lachnospiraceae bacterium]
MKNIAILGSTGSIGTQTLDIVSLHEEFHVVALAAGKNIELLEKQVRKYKPMLVSVWEEKDAKKLSENLRDLDITVEYGMEGLLKVATIKESDILVTAIVGMLGIRPTIAAMEAGKDIALANKETLVTAGHIIMPLAKEKGVSILPVDSEHSAIFQCLEKHTENPVKHIWLTASGGPFRGRTKEQLKDVTIEDALNHPNWSMGKKITVDSATMVNKGLEVMEAKWLFGVDVDRIKVLVHPQSVLHSAVEYMDGAVIGQMGTPDMHLPIQYALCYPKREALPYESLDFYTLGQMTFEKPDEDTFRGLYLAKEALKKGGNMPTVFNAANEMAVAMFLNRKIKFLEIVEIIESCMQEVGFQQCPTVEQILETQKETEGYIESRWKR